MPRWPSSTPSADACSTRSAWMPWCAATTACSRSARSTRPRSRGQGEARMREAAAWVKERLSGRSDSEHAQALVRIALIALILGYVLLHGPRDNADPTRYRDVLAIVLGGLVLGLGLFSALLANPERSDVRRVLGMLADYGLKIGRAH